MTGPPTVPYDRSRLVALRELSAAVKAKDARKVALIGRRLRFVFGLRRSEILAAIPDIDGGALDDLLEEGEAL